MRTIMDAPKAMLLAALTAACGCDAEPTPPPGETCEVAECASPAAERESEPCEANAPIPSLPFPAGIHMGVTQGPGCGGHKGKLAHAYDFNIDGNYETDHDLVAVASADGTVYEVVDDVTSGCKDCTSAEYNGGWGNCVIVKLDGACLFERYCHLDFSGVLVSEGQRVCRGTPLGRIGSTGKSTGPHLHWQRERGDGQSVPVATFAETSVDAGCNPCLTDDPGSGCFASANEPTTCCEATYAIKNAAEPEFTAAGAGCALGGGPTLKTSVSQISPSTMRFYVRKSDDSPFTEPATLTLYVGEGPSCGNPHNVAKASAPVVVGEATQIVDLQVEPYAGWAIGETKQFWIGKSESGFAAARATAAVAIEHVCD